MTNGLETTLLAALDRLAVRDPYLREAVLCAVIERWSVSAIRLKFHWKRDAEVRDRLEPVLLRLQALPEVRAAVHAFEQELLPCAENQDDHDERPEGVCGVTPDRASERFQGARIVPRDDLRLTQVPLDAVRWWVRTLPPAGIEYPRP